ncbi:hypothetical protein Tco_0016928 [Tanacetum coccineum]
MIRGCSSSWLAGVVEMVRGSSENSFPFCTVEAFKTDLEESSPEATDERCKPQYVDLAKSLPSPLPPAAIIEPTKDDNTEMEQVWSLQAEYLQRREKRDKRRLARGIYFFDDSRWCFKKVQVSSAKLSGCKSELCFDIKLDREIFLRALEFSRDEGDKFSADSGKEYLELTYFARMKDGRISYEEFQTTMKAGTEWRKASLAQTVESSKGNITYAALNLQINAAVVAVRKRRYTSSRTNVEDGYKQISSESNLLVWSAEDASKHSSTTVLVT